MDRIAFLISDLSMQQMVHTILDTYKEKLEQHHFIIDVEIIDFPNLVAQAHALVEKRDQGHHHHQRRPPDTDQGHRQHSHPLSVQLDQRRPLCAAGHCPELQKNSLAAQ